MKTKHVKVLLSTMIVLAMAWAFVACSKKKDATPTVDKTSLSAAVTAANAIVASSHEGVAAGDYLRGSQTAYVSAIAQAQAVLDDDAATTVEVTAAIANLAAATSTYAAALVTPIDPTNLIGQWTFDEVGAAVAGATVKDYSGNGHDGELKAGSPHWAGSGVPSLAADRYGVEGKALSFDKGQNVEVPYATSLNPAMMSISLWMKQTPETNIYADQYMVSLKRWLGYKFQMQGDPQPFFSARVALSPGDTTGYDHDAATSDGLTQGTWFHVVVTFGNGHEVFYTNGIKVRDWGTDVDAPGTPGTIVSLAANPVNLIFGQDLPTDRYSDVEGDDFYVNWGGYFHGSLDEIRIYKSVLTQSQVTSIYTLEKP